MKKKTIKAKISAALSASMVLAMLAPAMPAYAANSKLIFNFKDNNDAVKNITQNIELDGATTDTISSKAQALFNSWVVNSDGTIGLPYWSGTFNKSINNPIDWDTAMDLDGYVINSWKDESSNGRGNKEKVDLLYFQPNDISYYATLGQGVDNIASYWVTRKGKNGVYVPGAKNDDAVNFKAGQAITVKADLPGGYKLLNVNNSDDGNGKRTLDVFESKSPNATGALSNTISTSPHYAKENAVDVNFDAVRRVVSGNAHNRDMVINFTYDVDENQKFNLNIWDVFLDKDGNLVSRKKRPQIQKKVLEALPSIGFDTTNIQSSSSTPPKYMIATTVATYGDTPSVADTKISYKYGNVEPTYTSLADAHPVTVVFSKDEEPTSSAEYGDFKDKGLVDANINPTTSLTTPTEDDKTFNIKSDFELTDYNGATNKLRGRNSDYSIHGKMLNQSVSVFYAYMPNPDYYTNVTVEYIDEMGNNITDKVVNAIGATGYSGDTIEDSYIAASHVPTKLYKDGNSLVLKVDAALASTHVNIPIPKLAGYKFGTAGDVTIAPTNAQDWQDNYSSGADPSVTNVNANYAKSEIYQTSTANTSVTLKVMYQRDLGQLVAISPTVDSNGGGTLKVNDTTSGALRDYDTASYPADKKYVERKSSTTAGAADVELTSDSLPTPVADVGYEFEHWTYNGQDFTSSDLPKTFTIAGASSASNVSMDIAAHFKKDASKYNIYNLEAGDGYTGFMRGQHPEILNVDSSNNPRDIHFSDLSANTGINTGIVINPTPFGTNYNVVWYDSSNNVILKLDSSGSVLEQDNRPIINGETFKVYIESNVTPTAYDPIAVNNASGQPEYLNNLTGEPQIAIDQVNPSAMSGMIDYVVTDNAGNIVQIIPGTTLISQGGIISNTATSNFLTPGNSYRVYTALRNSGATVGSPIPATNVSANPLNVTIPVAPTPLVTADPAHAGMASIRINPTADNTEYALVDNAGNIVYPFTTPTAADNGTITFDNLDPDTVYHVVPRAAGSNATVPDRMAAGAQLQVDTSNLGLSTDEFKVEVVTDHPLTPIIQQVKIDAQSATEADLNSVRKGKSVEILAPLSDAAGNNFYTWRVISPATGVTVTQGTNGTPTSQASTRIVFTMPTGPVKLQIMYDDGTTWDPDNWTGNNASNHNIGVAVPSTNAPAGSKMRITIKKDQVPANIKQLVADTLLEEYKPEYMFRIVVEKQDASGNWVEYTDPSGDIHLDDVRVNTGVLDFSKNYMLHELATSSNAVNLVRDNIGRINSTTSDPSYVGEFGQNMYAGMTYIFGYSKPVYHKVKVVDNRDNALVANLRIPETNVVNDYATSYSSHIQADTVDNNGITWHYEGLSTDKNNYTAYDPTTRVTDDMTVYIFYSNDKDARRKAENDLSSAIQNANNQLNRINDPAKKAALQAAINAAQAVINRTNRKSSTPELLAAIDALNAAVKAAGGTVPNNNGGGGRGRGGRGGSGGGSGSAGRRAAAGQTAGLRVGQDGNWELLNPAQATANPDSSKWVFNLTAGGRVKGWAYLSYTYEGQTKSEWYHFGDDNIMNSGWFLDGNTWYYLSMNHNGFFGEMVKGWHHDGQDGRWYYLDANNGAMHTNWSKIGGEYYFLNPTAPAQTWFYDNATGRWNFGDVNSRPLGSMYQNENTPDGYHVNESGAWRR